MSKVILFGCGRGADVAYRHLAQDSEHEVCGFTVDVGYCNEREFYGLPLVPFEQVESLFPPRDYKMFILMGYQNMNYLRAEKYMEAKSKGYSFVNYINSRVYSLEKINLGENCFLMNGQFIDLDVTIGNNVVIWSCNHIGDSTVIGNHVFISSGVTIAGNVTIGDHCFLGMNCTISNNVVLAPETFVGANGLISKNSTPGSVYVNPDTKSIGNDSMRFLKVMETMEKL